MFQAPGERVSVTVGQSSLCSHALPLSLWHTPTLAPAKRHTKTVPRLWSSQCRRLTASLIIVTSWRDADSFPEGNRLFSGSRVSKMVYGIDRFVCWRLSVSRQLTWEMPARSGSRSVTHRWWHVRAFCHWVCPPLSVQSPQPQGNEGVGPTPSKIVHSNAPLRGALGGGGNTPELDSPAYHIHRGNCHQHVRQQSSGRPCLIARQLQHGPSPRDV